MRKSVTQFDFDAAFKALDEISVPTVRGLCPTKIKLSESLRPVDRWNKLMEDFYDVNDPEALDQAQTAREDEIAKAKLARIEKIVDLDADSADDLLTSYSGKVIIQCPQCMTLFYKNEADLTPDETDPSTVNVAEKCQHCGNENGYIVIGKVAPVDDSELGGFDAAAAEELPEEEPDFAADEETDNTEAAEEDGSAAEEGAEDFDLPEMPEADEAEAEPEANESLHRSKFLKNAENDELNTKYHSEHLTLEEELPDVETINSTTNVRINDADAAGDLEVPPDLAPDFAEADEEELPECMNKKSLHEAAENWPTDISEMSDADIQGLFNSAEFATPVSDETVQQIFADDKAAEAKEDNEAATVESLDELEEIDDETLEEAISTALKQVFTNVQDFRLTKCQLTENNQLQTHGKILFKSGKTKRAVYTFTESASKGSLLQLRGTSASVPLDLRLNGTVTDRKFIVESTRSTYDAKRALAEGLVLNKK